MNEKIRILIGSPIRQDPDILENFLNSLRELEMGNFIVDYYLVNNNDNSGSKKLIEEFCNEFSENVIINHVEAVEQYIRTDDTHFWSANLVWKVAEYKNKIIEHCKKKDYDYLFLVDSDLVLHPKTLECLVATNKDIISEIFWTKWKKDTMGLPQVWLYDEYSLIQKKRFEILNKQEEQQRCFNFLQQLKKPGIYEVGGLGACTLISRDALNKGVNYNEIYNLTFHGEDRHFCIRAAAMGYKLYVDTTYPAYHIYRKEYLKGVEDFKNKCKNSLKSFPIKSLKVEVENFSKEFLETFYSCDYRTLTWFKALKYLTPKYINKLIVDQNRVISYLKGKKVICNSEVLEIKIDANCTEADCILQLTKSINLDIVKENYNCKLFLKLQENSHQWNVNFIELTNYKSEPIFGVSLVDLIEEKIRLNKSKENKLTLSMLVRNEGNKFIKEILEHAAKYIDSAVILDDASDDDTIEICKAALKNVPLIIVSNKEQGFDNEILLRKQLWEMTIDTNPDWILSLDADEMFEDKIIDAKWSLINQPDFDFYCFRLYDMWDKLHYREDDHWKAHNYYRPFLIRFQPNFDYTWREMPLHCGRISMNIFSLKGCTCDVRLKHFGWATKQIREEKYKRYLKLDSDGKYGDMEQYKSILDENPHLSEWK